jgi:sugar transferase (PEP-CTERM system associated)
MKKRQLYLILGDILLAVLAIYAGIFLRFGTHIGSNEMFELFGIKVGVFVASVLFASFLLELYNFDKNHTKKEIVINITISMALTYLVLSSVYYLLPEFMIGRGILGYSLVSLTVFQIIWHSIYNTGLNLPAFAQRVLVLGTGPLANKIGAVVLSTNHNHVLSGYVACASEADLAFADNVFNLENEGLIEMVKREKADKIVVSLSERRGSFPLHDVLSCKMNGVEVIDAPSFYEEVTGKLLLENINPSWFIFSEGFRITRLRLIGKRIGDILLSVVGLILCIPILPVIALSIWISSPGPILFRQVRVGEREKHFVLYKFRSMSQDSEKDTGAVWAQKDDPRVTKVGKFLRVARLDEIPQLFNVLKGDMGFVGPRPERPEFVEKLNLIIPYYSNRHLVKPGITGWAQVKYSYGASVDDAIEKLRYDLYYVKNLNIALDVLIVLETIKVVLFGKGGR